MTAAGPGADRHAIAIIGLACRFPGADGPGEFWRNLCSGRESIRAFSEEELLAAGVAPDLLRDPHYVRAAPVLNDIETFDAAFFGYSPREAALTDPQHRLFLEVAWEAFEDAGYHPETCPGVVGVVAGGGGVVSSYLVAHPGHPALCGDTATLPHIGNDKDFLATRVSYKLNLTGPSLTVQTACSTSLVAVHLAGQSLRAGECDMVLAGVSTVRIPHLRGYVAERGQVHSLDGHCRAFDAAGQGAIFGSGVAAVLLRRLEDAVAAGDHIYAVIKSTAVTNDGGRKVSYTAPSVMGQARAMVEALTLSDVAADTIGYVECHAAGTNVGDPLEIQALTRAFARWAR
jgi:acyl transferase domain-containing protein